MIARAEKFFASAGRSKTCAFRVVGTAGKKLQSQERMSRAAFAQVNLDRVSLPRRGIVLARDHEIECESADHARVAQEIANLGGIARDSGGIGWICREGAAEISLPARAAKHLIVRGEQLHFAERCDAQLYARAAHFPGADTDPLFHDTAARVEFFPVLLEAGGGVFEAHRAEAFRDGGFVRLAETREIDERVAFTGNAFIEFHYGLRE